MKNKSLIISIAIAVVVMLLLLLNSLGLLSSTFWNLLGQIWPLALVLVIAYQVLQKIPGIGFLLASIALLAVGWAWQTSTIPAVDAYSESLDQGVGSSDCAEVNLRVSVAELRLSGSANPSSSLITAQIDKFPGESLYKNFSRTNLNSGEVLGIYQLESRGFRQWWRPSSIAPKWQVRLGSDTPTYLNIVTGIGRSDVSLKNVNLKAFSISTGIGSTNITLPEHGRFRASIKSGIGGMRIKVPSSMSVRVTASAGLGSIETRGDFSTSDNNKVFFSDNYRVAEDYADIDVDTGIGKVVVESLPF